jgi:hypothetical protein
MREAAHPCVDRAGTRAKHTMGEPTVESVVTRLLTPPTHPHYQEVKVTVATHAP